MIAGRLNWWGMLGRLVPNILMYALAGTIAVVLNVLFAHPEYWGLPATISTWSKTVLLYNDEGVPFTIISALGAALAIFLGFRNSSAYDRWWEARKIWGALVNDSRSWARQVTAWITLEDAGPGVTPEQVEAARRELILRQIALVWGLGIHLRQQEGLLERIGAFLPDREVEHYRTVPNVITALILSQGRRVADFHRQGLISEWRHLWMDELLTRMSDIQGKCERIKNTPIPRQYDEIPRIFVVVYGLILPFGLVPAMGWVALPIATVVAVLFALLERSGRIIEDPFENKESDTPMTALSVTIERDLRAALSDPLPAPYAPTGGRSQITM